MRDQVSCWNEYYLSINYRGASSPTLDSGVKYELAPC